MRERGRNTNQNIKAKDQRQKKKEKGKKRGFDYHDYEDNTQFFPFQNDNFFTKIRKSFNSTNLYEELHHYQFKKEQRYNPQNNSNKGKKSTFVQSNYHKQYRVDFNKTPSRFQVRRNHQIENFKKKRMGKKQNEEENFFRYKFNSMFGPRQQRSERLELKIALMQILVQSTSLVNQNQYDQIMLPSTNALRLYIEMRLNEIFNQNSQFQVLNLLLVTNEDIKQGFNKIYCEYQDQEEYIMQSLATYCINFYREKQVELLKSNLKNIVNKTQQITNQSQEISFPISSLNLVIFNIIYDDYYQSYGDDNLDSITFGRSYLRLFEQYREKFFKQKEKEHQIIIYDSIYIGTGFYKNKRNCENKKEIEVYPAYKNSKADIQFFNRGRYFLLDISLSEQVIIRVTIPKQSIKSINIFSQPPQVDKKILFRLSTPPSFQAQFNPINISMKNGKCSSYWHTINNFALQYNDYFIGKDIVKFKFSKDVVIGIQTKEMGKSYIQNFEKCGLGSKMLYEQIVTIQRSLSEFEADEANIYTFAQRCSSIIKDNLAVNQNCRQNLIKLHYIQLDYLLSIQYGTYNKIHPVFQALKANYLFDIQEINATDITQLPEKIFNIINEFFQEIHINKLYEKEHRSFKKSKKENTKYKRQKIYPIYNVAFTPSGLKLRGYTNQFQSRVFRQFNYLLFIKVTFCKDDGTLIVPQTHYNDSKYLIKNVFRQNISGFKLGGVQYLPLGWSNSQIKKQQMWFVNCDNAFYQDLRADIYRFLGDFSIISNPAKRAARIGQNFAASVPYSQSVTIVPQVIEDIYTPIIKKGEIYIGYNFSDGIGQLSENILLKIIQQYKLPKDICALQCRYLGCKGVFSLGKYSKIPNKLFIRQSMKKFECQDNRARKHLDILSWNKYSPGYINTEIILLLMGLNVPLYQFFKKVDEFMVKQVYNLKYSNQCLVNYFKTHLDYSPANDDSLFELLCFICNNQDEALKKLLVQEIYFCQLLAKVKRELSLKLKNNLHIKIQKAVRLMGILDNFGILKENQIYCSFIKNTGETKYNVNERRAFLTRNPCLHPGDIKLVRCLSDQEIEKRFKENEMDSEFIQIFKRYINVIVFPQKGKYPLTTLISGGDLDGDYYLLCWDKDLIPYQSQLTRRYQQHIFDNGQIQKQKALKIIQRQMQDKNFGKNEKEQQNQNQTSIDLQELFQQISLNSQKNSLQANIQSGNNKLNDPSYFSQQILDFYISFLEKSQLGLIATMHKIWAQYNTVNCNQCLRLAQIHSHEIDYAKKGKKIPLPSELRPKRSMQIFSSRNFKTDLNDTDVGKIYGKITKYYYDNQLGKNATHQLDVAVPSPYINHWILAIDKETSFSYTEIQINEILEIALAYKKDIENSLIKNQKMTSCEFYIYHGKDEDVITDQILIRQKYLLIFFCDSPESLDIYQSLKVEQTLSKQSPQFSDQIYRKAFLWYIVSNSLSLLKNNYIRHIRKDIYSIIKKSEDSINKSTEQFVNKLISGELTNYQPFKFDQYEEKPKGFPNVYGLAWNVIPKIILKLINKAYHGFGNK